jgi:uncharacterized protein YjdB
MVLTAIISPSDAYDNSVTWSSSDTTVATVDQTGKVTAVGLGNAVITATTNDGGKTATCNVTVTNKVSSISVNTSSGQSQLCLGDSVQMLSTVSPSAATQNVTWSVQNGSGTATINPSGILTATKAGTVTVLATATDGSGVSGNKQITVYTASITSGKYTVDAQGGYLKGIGAQTSISTLVSNLGNGSSITVYSNQSQVTSGNISTGMTINLVMYGKTQQTLTAVVTGDVNGDGNISITDLLQVESSILKKSNLQSANAVAADTNKDSSISITDLLQIESNILGKSKINP